MGIANSTKNVIFLIFNLAQAHMKHLRRKTRLVKACLKHCAHLIIMLKIVCLKIVIGKTIGILLVKKGTSGLTLNTYF